MSAKSTCLTRAELVEFWHIHLSLVSWHRPFFPYRFFRYVADEILTAKDGHIDFPVAMRAFYHNQIDNKEWRQAFEDGTLPGHVDLARLRHGQTGGAFWSVYAPCPTNGDDFSDENLAAST